MHSKFIGVNKSRLIVCVLGAVLLLSITYLWSAFRADSYLVSKKILRFNYALKNTSAELVENASFSVSLPIEIKGAQKVISVDAVDEYSLVNKAEQKQSIMFPINQIPPYGTKLINFTVIVESTDKPRGEDVDISGFLKEEPYIEVGSKVIKDLAFQLKAGEADKTAKNIYEWLVNNANPSDYTVDSKGAQYLIEKKFGDCTEFMYAFIALARANGVPARGVRGFSIPDESEVINSADYHDWAEFYDGNRWVLVDAYKKSFDQNQLNYVVVGLLNDFDAVRFDMSNQKISVSFSQ